MFLENYWYCAALPHEVDARPLRRVICNEPVVFYRDTKGKLVALEDRCSHRQAPLSTGEIRGDNIQCNYHGFVFDRDGKCVHIPCLLYTSPSPRDYAASRMPSSA